MLKSVSIPAQYLEAGEDPKGRPLLEQWFLNLMERVSEPARVLLRNRLLTPSPESPVQQVQGRGLRISVPNQFPDGADLLVQGLHSEDHDLTEEQKRQLQKKPASTLTNMCKVLPTISMVSFILGAVKYCILCFNCSIVYPQCYTSSRCNIQ